VYSFQTKNINTVT